MKDGNERKKCKWKCIWAAAHWKVDKGQQLTQCMNATEYQRTMKIRRTIEPKSGERDLQLVDYRRWHFFAGRIELDIYFAFDEFNTVSCYFWSLSGGMRAVLVIGWKEQTPSITSEMYMSAMSYLRLAFVGALFWWCYACSWCVRAQKYHYKTNKFQQCQPECTAISSNTYKHWPRTRHTHTKKRLKANRFWKCASS